MLSRNKAAKTLKIAQIKTALWRSVGNYVCNANYVAVHLLIVLQAQDSFIERPMTLFVEA